MTLCYLFNATSLMNKIYLFFLVISHCFEGWKRDLICSLFEGFCKYEEAATWFCLWRGYCCFLEENFDVAFGFWCWFVEEVVFGALNFYEKFLETRTLNCWITALLFFKIFCFMNLMMKLLAWTLMLTGTRLMLQILLSPGSILLPFPLV